MTTTASVLLTLAADEMRETRELLRIIDVATAKRPWWRTLVLFAVSDQQQVVGGMAFQYLADNIERATEHWSEALAHLDQLVAAAPELAHLRADLRAAGLDTVLPRLHPDAVPIPLKPAATHLVAVGDTIRDCVQVLVAVKQGFVLGQLRATEGERSPG